MKVVRVELPLRTVSEANVRDRWRTRARRAANHRGTVAKALRPRTGVLPEGEIVDVELVRVSAGTLDDDNLRSALKAVRDGVADALGLKSDADSRVRWSYSQQRCERGLYAVRINIAARSTDVGEATTEWGCEARRKLGIARGALQAARQSLDDISVDVTDLDKALVDSSMPHVRCTDYPIHIACGDDITDRDDEHRQSVCLLVQGHPGDHYDPRTGATWTSPKRSEVKP